jgi:hypothetical protein
VTTITLALLMVGLGLIGEITDTRPASLAAIAVGTLFFGSLIYLLVHGLLFEVETVSGETLWAAINVYLLIGILFAFLYAIIAALVPEGFTGPGLGGTGENLGVTFLYFSFVTMTTLGYGDISPNVQIAATLAYVQALIGQLYVAILIARLVSLYSVQANRE